jgi:DNA-binding transcriptional MerR regulator
MPSAGMTIGALAKLTDTKIVTIRFYEANGLMAAPVRGENGRRIYEAGAVRRLSFIRHAREFGFALESIKRLLALHDNPRLPCGEADALAQAQLVEVEAKVARLTALRDELRCMIAQCDSRHIGGCRVMEVLADHRQCQHEHH